jgi:uncharacterized protein YfaP (DUF2135 family)
MTVRHFDLLLRPTIILAISMAVTISSSCGGGQSSSGGTAQVSVSISPTSATVPAGQSQQFTATVTGAGQDTIQWDVAGTYGGTTTAGTISQTGLYTAPSIPPKPNSVMVTATSSVGPPFPQASAQVTLTPGFTDFSALPAQIDTNLPTFFVSGSASVGDTVTVNGASIPLDRVGNFVTPVPLAAGANRIELDIQSGQMGTVSFVKTVTLDPNLSMAGRRLLYVSSINAQFSGTIVIDVDNNIFLGFIQNKHVRGISPDGKQIYMDDLSVIDTATHQELQPPASPLTFSQSIPSDGFLVSPDGRRLYSRDEGLDVATNQLLPNRLPVNIETGAPYDGPDQGGPAITPDGQRIFCLGLNCSNGNNTIIGINISDNSTFDTGILPSNFGLYLSDIVVTPDGRFILVSSYGVNRSGSTGAQIYDASSFRPLFSSAIFLGDFAGQAVVSKDGTKGIFGSAGNPAFGGGAVTVIDLASWITKASVNINLADHLAISDRNDLFVSSSNAPGILVFSLLSDGTLTLQSQFVLGINQLIGSSGGAPQGDDIEKIVFKLAY